MDDPTQHDPTQRARRRLKWARKHLEAFHKEVAPFALGQAHILVGECEIATRDEVARIYFHQHPRAEAGLIAGDFIHNLRASLDNLVWDFARLKRDPPPRDTEFVIASDCDAFKRNRYKLNGLKPLARKVVQDLQPCCTPQPKSHPLNILNLLWNDDKHRYSPTAVSAVGRFGQNIRTAHFKGTTPIRFSPGIVEDGSEVFRIREFQPGEHMDGEIELLIDVALDHTSRAAPGQMMRPLFEHLYDHVFNDVLPRFEKIVP